jgi:hypothetical protein
MSASLSFLPALSRPGLLAAPVAEALRAWPGGEVVIGSGIRGSKLRLPGRLVAAIPSAQVLPGLGVPVNP